MSTVVFPSLTGQGWSVTRTEIWQTRKQQAISGKRTQIADWSVPLHQWELTFEFLRQAGSNMQASNFMGQTFAEFAQLSAFFNLRSGGFDSFLYQDPDDFSVTGQGLGTTVTGQTVYPIVRSFGGFFEPILAPNTGGTINVKLNGTTQSPSSYTINTWGTSDLVNGPGQIVFGSAPTGGETLTIDMTYYFPVSFDDDKMSFEKFMAALYALKKISFTSFK